MKNIVLWVLLLESFWGVNVVDYKLTQLFMSIAFMTYFVYFRLESRKRNSTIMLCDRFVLCVFGCLLLNAIACWINRGQSIFLTFCTPDFRNFLSLFFFYYLVRKNFSIEKVERALEILFFSYCVCFLVEYFLFFPTPIFHLLGLNVGEHRFRLVGQLINFIGFFYFLNKYLIGEKNRKNIVGILLGMLCIFLLGFRSFLVSVSIVSLVQVFRVVGVSKSLVKIFLMIGLAACCAYQFDFTQKVVKNMVDRQAGQERMGDDYIRLREWRYFTEEHFLNGFDRFFGSGPENEKSQYGKNMTKMRVAEKYYSYSVATWWDWGLIGLSWAMGIPLAIFLLLFVLYMILFKTEKKYMYVSSVYLLLLLTGVSTMEIYRFGAITFHALMLYLVCKIREEKELVYENRDYNSSSVV